MRGAVNKCLKAGIGRYFISATVRRTLTTSKAWYLKPNVIFRNKTADKTFDRLIDYITMIIMHR